MQHVYSNTCIVLYALPHATKDLGLQAVFNYIFSQMKTCIMTFQGFLRKGWQAELSNSGFRRQVFLLCFNLNTWLVEGSS